MLSDTGFNSPENEVKILLEIDKMTSNGGIGFYLFQLDGVSKFSKDLEERGLPVQYINSAEDW